MDIRDLGFEDMSFDVAIDKGNYLNHVVQAHCLNKLFPSGTMDAMMTTKGDVWVGRLFVKVDDGS